MSENAASAEESSKERRTARGNISRVIIAAVAAGAVMFRWDLAVRGCARRVAQARRTTPIRRLAFPGAAFVRRIECYRRDAEDAQKGKERSFAALRMTTRVTNARCDCGGRRGGRRGASGLRGARCVRRGIFWRRARLRRRITEP